MEVTGWGQYPKVTAEISSPSVVEDIQEILNGQKEIIPFGLGRSYGDSALASHIIQTKYLDHFFEFSPECGDLTCAAGLSLADILEVFVPQGWFLPVSPGTKFVTVGGAIASDIHGKNHHVAGCFSEHISSLRLLLASGEVIECSATENQDLFRATCGGMGLTGLIVSATLRLLPIKSAFMKTQTIKATCLEEAVALFDEHQKATYSVAWIDCMATGKSLGRSLLMLGEHTGEGPLTVHSKKANTVPFDMPSGLLNNYAIKAFNALYYHRAFKKASEATVHYNPYFYPLDGIHHWNRLYGKKGFTQYQFVIPFSAGLVGLTEIIQKIASSKQGSFLAVLKVFGKANANYLSFPMAGYTLALDFKINEALFPLLDTLDQMVLNYGGRVYLTKDVRMTEETFKRSYSQWETFMACRESVGAHQVFNSLQSKRLGL